MFVRQCEFHKKSYFGPVSQMFCGLPLNKAMQVIAPDMWVEWELQYSLIDLSTPG